MAAPILHAELISAKFPYNFSELSSTIVLNQGLEIQRGSPQSFQGAEASQQAGIPQAYYMENVVPIARGFSSVAYSKVIDEIPSFTGAIIEAFEIRGAPAGLAILAVTENEQWIYDAFVGHWVQLTVPTYDPGGTTIANVKGITYIFIVGSGIYTYNFSSQQLEVVAITGLDVGEIAGIFAAGAVLGAWTDDLRILWSSNIDPTNFVPSLSTGAGSSSVLAVSSQIVTVLALGQDFIIYTATNAVSGRQTGNVQYPFVFKEITGSTGIAYSYHVAHNTNSDLHITYSASGFQQVSVQQAEYIWPELSEGLAKGIRIKLGSITERPEITYAASVDVRLQFCSNSYLTVSVRDHNSTTTNTVYTEAFVFDTKLNRWGHIVANHVCISEYTLQIIEGLYLYSQLESDYINYNALEVVPNPALSYRDIESNPVPAGAKPGSNFALIGLDGRVHLLAPSQTANFRGDNVGIVAALPRIFLGKYKVVRDSGIVLHALRVNKLIACDIVAHGHGLDGSYIRRVENFKENRKQPGHWMERISADSVTIEFNGSFALTDLSLECESSGTYNQYSSPPVKKFYSYINSVPYPIYVTDHMGLGGNTVGGGILPSLYRDDMSLGGSILGGTLESLLKVIVQYDIDKTSLSGSITDGTLVLSYIPIYITQYDIDKLSLTGTISSGTLVQTYFPVSHTQYDIDKLSLAGSITGGTLA